LGKKRRRKMGMPRNSSLLKDILKSGRLPECIKCGNKHEIPAHWYATYPVCSEECWQALRKRIREISRERKKLEEMERTESEREFQERYRNDPSLIDLSLVEDPSQLFG
jgi:hypothetical protein